MIGDDDGAAADDTDSAVMVVDGTGGDGVCDTVLSLRLLRLLLDSEWIPSDCRVQGTSSEPFFAPLKMWI